MWTNLRVDDPVYQCMHVSLTLNDLLSEKNNDISQITCFIFLFDPDHSMIYITRDKFSKGS